MSDLIKRPKHDQFPFAPDPHDLYGWTLERKKKLVDSLETVLHEGMQAVKHARITHQGEVTEEYEDIDFMVRLRAAELAGQVTGLRQQTKEVQPVVNITIQTPSWAIQGSPKQINPQSEDEPAEPMPGDDAPND